MPKEKRKQKEREEEEIERLMIEGEEIYRVRGGTIKRKKTKKNKENLDFTKSRHAIAI